MTAQSVIVTGGAGFIGSNLADALAARGDRVVVVDDLSNGKQIQVPPDAEFHHMDIRDAAALRALAVRVQPSVIFHLAAQADVRKAIEDPGFDADVNVSPKCSDSTFVSNTRSPGPAESTAL